MLSSSWCHWLSKERRKLIISLQRFIPGTSTSAGTSFVFVYRCILLHGNVTVPRAFEIKITSLAKRMDRLLGLTIRSKTLASA